MTDSTTTMAAANGGPTTTPAPREHGLAALRAHETKALISLASDAMSEVFDLVHQLHAVIYAEQPDTQAEPLLDEALLCLQTAEHYLLMLGSVFEQRRKSPGDQDPTGTAL